LALVLQGFKIAFTAVVAALLALYAPLLSLNAYSTTLSEVVYEGSNYKVTYKSPLIPLAPGNKTNVVLEVKRNGKPVDFGFTLSGITIDGAKDVAKGRGYGRAKADIAGYVDDVVRVLREANSNPAHSGLGLLTFLVSKIEEDGEEYIATDIISIPVIPEKARGKNIVVEVEFKPVHKVKLNKTSSGEQTGKAEVLQTTPPGTITYECKSYMIIGQECYKWELTKTHYVSSDREYIPLSISYIDNTDGNYTKMVVHEHLMVLEVHRITSVSLDMSLTFRKVKNFMAPGPGFVIYLPPGVSRLELFRMSCPFTNSYLTSETHDCRYFGSSVGKFTFYKDALIATGIRGRAWLVEYQYVKEKCVPLLGCSKEVLDSSLAVYMVPYFRSTNRIDYSVYIDENPYDGLGWLNRVFNFLYFDSNATRRLLEVYLGSYVDIWSTQLMSKSESTPLFGIAISIGSIIRALAGSPPGWPGRDLSTLSIGFSVSYEERAFYMGLGKILYYTTTDRCFYPYYIELTAFLVKDAKDYYKTPLMVVSPNTRTPSQYPPPPMPLSSLYCPPP
jgi:hypothetical protein